MQFYLDICPTGTNDKLTVAYYFRGNDAGKIKLMLNGTTIKTFS